MKNGDITDKVKTAVSSTVTALGYELVDVEYVKKNESITITVFIFAKDGTTLDDCEKVHLAIDPVMDELNPTFDAPYTLNVSSPGLDRPFKTQRDFERNYGEEVETKLYAPLKGKKVIEGILIEKKLNCVIIETLNETLTIEDSKIVFVRPLVKFE